MLRIMTHQDQVFVSSPLEELQDSVKGGDRRPSQDSCSEEETLYTPAITISPEPVSAVSGSSSSIFGWTDCEVSANNSYQYAADKDKRKSNTSSNSQTIETFCSMVKFEFSESLKRDVALKVVKSEKLARNEIEALTALKHIPSIPVLLDHTIDGADGETMLTFPVYNELVTKKIDLFKIASYFKEIGEVLEQVHSAGWCHLDISPNNFMLDPVTEKIVLIDFGLAKRIGAEHQVGCGTSGFIAPEVYSSTHTTSASDIYSAGILLGTLLEPFVPGISLHYLGSALVRLSTTSFICNRIKEISGSKFNEFNWKPIIYNAADLLFKMLQVDPELRISASELLRHPFLTTSSAEHFDGFDYETHSRKLLLRPIGLQARRDPVVLYRG